MNCRPGDLARYVGAVERNYGRFVRVVSPAVIFETGEPAWVTEPALYLRDGRLASHVADRLLKPIRPGDISDEEVRELYSPKVPEAA